MDHHTGHGFLLRQGTFTTLDDPAAFGPNTQAWGINDAGSIVGAFADAFGSVHSFLLSGGTYTTIDPPQAGSFSVAFGINARGWISGNYNDADDMAHGSLLADGQYVTIDHPIYKRTQIRGINALGQMVGLYRIPGEAIHGLIVTPAAGR